MCIAATEIVRRRINMDRREVVVRTVIVLTTLRIVSTLIFAFAGNFYIAVAANWAKSIFHSAQDPIYRAWLNQSIDSRVRATVLSMAGQSNAIGQIVGGPGIGAVGKYVSVPAALALSGLLLAPALPLYARAHRQGGDVEEALPTIEAPAPSEA
jgi:DHA3 family tetracycline resistance protein-like MFS transporter